MLIFLVVPQGCEEFKLRWWKVRLGAAGLNKDCCSAGAYKGSFIWWLYAVLLRI